MQQQDSHAAYFHHRDIDRHITGVISQQQNYSGMLSKGQDTAYIDTEWF